MRRRSLLEGVVEEIIRIEKPHPIRVAVDGIDCAGKSMFANGIAEVLSEQGFKVIRASLDGFHNPRKFRYARGKLNPEGYYLDSFNYKVLFEYLLDPLGTDGSRKYKTSVFDYNKDDWVNSETLLASDDDVLIFDGVFLLRPELENVWDLSIYLHVSYEESLKRALKRDQGDPEKIEERYEKRYIPGQKLYHMHVGPTRKADLIIDNSDPEYPEISYVNPRLMLDGD
jgi:uridine kinase